MVEPGQKIGDAWVAGSPSWSWYFFHSYNILIMVGILASFLTVAYYWKRQKYSWETLQIILIIIVPSAIFGARFYTLIFDGGWSQWYNLAGLSIYGGVIGAAIPASIFVYTRRSILDLRTAFGIIIPVILIGQAIGRWGNFDNHEVYGKMLGKDGSSLNWLTFIKPHMKIYHAEIGGTSTVGYRAPIFFYESMLSLLGYLVIVWVLQDRGISKPGVSGGLYFAYYGIVRLILQTQRDPSPMNTSYFGDSGVSVNLVVSILLIIAGSFLAITWQFNIGISITIKGKKITLWPKKEYEKVYAKKEVRRCWVGKKYERTFVIYDTKDQAKVSKRKINKEVSKKVNKNEK